MDEDGYWINDHHQHNQNHQHHQHHQHQQDHREHNQYTLGLDARQRQERLLIKHSSMALKDGDQQQNFVNQQKKYQYHYQQLTTKCAEEAWFRSQSAQSGPTHFSSTVQARNGLSTVHTVYPMQFSSHQNLHSEMMLIENQRNDF